MSVSAHGTTFSLRTPAHIKSCHMTGSWDNYTKRYALLPDPTSGAGFWSLTVKFGSSMPAARHWYYFILDGYFESHDPNRPTCVQPERKLTLNILDYFTPRTGSASSDSSSGSSSYRYASSPDSMTSAGSPTGSKRTGGYYHRRNRSRESRDGRTPSPRRINATNPHIVHPKPRNPLGNHKLTLNTSVGGAGYSPSSPGSAGSGRSSASSCSNCSGSTWSDGSSPATPICTCTQGHVRGDCDYDSEGFYEEYDSEYASEDEDFDDSRYRRLSRHVPPAEKKMAYAPADELAYRMQRVRV